MRKIVHNIGVIIRVFYLRYPIIFGIIAVTIMLLAGIFPVITGLGWIVFLITIAMLLQDFIRDVFGPCKRPLNFWR